MQETDDSNQVLQLVGKAAKEYGCTVLIFPKSQTTPSIRIVQPLQNGCGPDRRFVDEFTKILSKTADKMNLSRKLDITSITEEGSPHDKDEHTSNVVHKIKIVLHK